MQHTPLLRGMDAPAQNHSNINTLTAVTNCLDAVGFQPCHEPSPYSPDVYQFAQRFDLDSRMASRQTVYGQF